LVTEGFEQVELLEAVDEAALVPGIVRYAARLPAISRSGAESISLMSTLKYRPRNATMKMAAWKIEAKSRAVP
jgi:hypothetical protein